MKVAQLLATIPDALPQEYVARARPAAGQRAGRWAGRSSSGAWRAELGPGLGDDASRASSTRRPRAASLGQVHRAIAHDGRAARLQAAVSGHGVGGRGRPAASSSSSSRSIERYDRAITTDEIHAEIADAPARGARLRARGRAHAALSPHAARRDRRRMCPRPVPELSTDAAADHDLARRRAAAGVVEAAPLRERNEVAPQHVPRLVRAVLLLRRASTAIRISAITRCGADGSINLLDFGCIRVFPPRFVEGVIDLYHALDQRRPRPRRARLRDLGLQRSRPAR